MSATATQEGSTLATMKQQKVDVSGYFTDQKEKVTRTVRNVRRNSVTLSLEGEISYQGTPFSVVRLHRHKIWTLS